jgi:hypothetical protein
MITLLIAPVALRIAWIKNMRGLAVLTLYAATQHTLIFKYLFSRNHASVRANCLGSLYCWVYKKIIRKMHFEQLMYECIRRRRTGFVFIYRSSFYFNFNFSWKVYTRMDFPLSSPYISLHLTIYLSLNVVTLKAFILYLLFEEIYNNVDTVAPTPPPPSLATYLLLISSSDPPLRCALRKF